MTQQPASTDQTKPAMNLLSEPPPPVAVAVASDSAVSPATTFDEAALLKPLGGNRELARLVIVSATTNFPKYLVQLEQA